MRRSQFRLLPAASPFTRNEIRSRSFQARPLTWSVVRVFIPVGFRVPAFDLAYQAPIAPNLISIIAQVPGSGTAPTILARLRAPVPRFAIPLAPKRALGTAVLAGELKRWQPLQGAAAFQGVAARQRDTSCKSSRHKQVPGTVRWSTVDPNAQSTSS